MKQRLRELLCVLTGHRWEHRRTNEIDCELGFQPEMVIFTNSEGEFNLANIYISYQYCEHCGLVQDSLTVHAGFIAVSA